MIPEPQIYQTAASSGTFSVGFSSSANMDIILTIG
jgi:hypothetical protein